MPLVKTRETVMTSTSTHLDLNFTDPVITTEHRVGWPTYVYGSSKGPRRLGDLSKRSLGAIVREIQDCARNNQEHLRGNPQDEAVISARLVLYHRDLCFALAAYGKAEEKQLVLSNNTSPFSIERELKFDDSNGHSQTAVGWAISSTRWYVMEFEDLDGIRRFVTKRDLSHYCQGGELSKLTRREVNALGRGAKVEDPQPVRLSANGQTQPSYESGMN